MLRKTVFGQVAGPRAASHQEYLTFNLEATAARRVWPNHSTSCVSQESVFAKHLPTKFKPNEKSCCIFPVF